MAVVTSHMARSLPPFLNPVHTRDVTAPFQPGVTPSLGRVHTEAFLAVVEGLRRLSELKGC